MTRDKREKIKDITREEIKIAARQLMGERGTAGLSIRAIARQMGMTAPALYHYYSSLNELITALISDAFSQLADALEQAAMEHKDGLAADQLQAVAHRQRQWALARPIDFQLIYGNPIPNYEQPIAVTYPPARRSFLITANIFTKALAGGELVLPAGYQNLPTTLNQSLTELTQVEGHDLPLPALYLTAAAWAKIHGHIMLELFNLIQPVLSDVDSFYQHEMNQFMKQIGFIDLNNGQAD